MGAVRVVTLEIVEQFFEVIHDATLALQPFSVHYGDFSVTADRLQPLERRNAATYQLRSADAEAGQWGEQRAIRVLLRRAGAKLEQAFQYPHGWRDLVYDIGNAWQTDTELLIGFRLLSGGAGRNRWFGRRDGKIETRSSQAMETLAGNLRQELGRHFAAQNPGTDIGLPEQWLTVARLPLVSPTTLVATSATKTELVRQLSQALVVGELLRRQSFDRTAIESATRMRHPLNQILYGPPGTGKTFSTAAWAVTLLNPNNLPLEEVQAHYGNNQGALRQAFEQYRQRGQVGFVSFHQSFSYEDFVEGIKPGLNDSEGEEEAAGSLGYRIEAGIFKTMAERAIYGLHLQRQEREQAAGAREPQPVDFATLFALFTNYLLERLEQQGPGEVVLPTIAGSGVVLHDVTPKGNLRFYHQNGNAASIFAVSAARLEKLYRAFPTVAAITNSSSDIVGVIGGTNTSVYWAAFRELKEFEAQQAQELAALAVPFVNQGEQLQRAIDRPELAAQVARNYDFTQLTPEDYAAAPRFVLIVDEINRGNVAGIFGELISLLEDDKRGGQPNELRVTLPYSKESFTVPPNLYVLGTMNTADRSVEALDTALRRRFSFHELAPQPAQLAIDVAGIDLRALLTALNERLEVVLDRDHRLGHAWLLSVRTLEDLRTVFREKLIPQLQEYFYGHWERLGQVLGVGFVQRKADAVRLMPGFDDDAAGSDEPRPRYEITPASAWTAEAFRALYTR